MNEVGSGPFILTINGGSSSLKCSLYHVGPPLACIAYFLVDRVGFPEGTLTLTDVVGGTSERGPIQAAYHKDCVDPLIAWLKQKITITDLVGIGHRVVHGGRRYYEPQRITPDVTDELKRLSPYDLEHLPAEIELIEAFNHRFPLVLQVACFDTAFHSVMPRVSRLLPIPRRYDKMGVQRYGFHGLSCAYVIRELQRIGLPNEANGRVIIAHLGNGASLTAVHQGRSIDTTMSFTPAAGLPMSRRSGDVDPGLVSYLARTEGMTAEQFHTMTNTESGLLGISETSSDMRDLLACEARDVRAAEAVAVFCYHVKKGIGAFGGALGGLDTLVFTGGVGENSAVVRSRICEGLDFLGVVVDDACNRAGGPIISVPGTEATVRVMHTDEESEIARSVSQLIHVSDVTRATRD
ncbi:MAG: acetate/propionate family kinase [Nitrospiraceae bacterium]